MPKPQRPPQPSPQDGTLHAPRHPAHPRTDKAAPLGFFGRLRKSLGYALGYEDPWLSAGDPIAPRLPEGEPPRQFQYTPGVNLQMVPRSTETITFSMLRNLSEYTLVRIVIERIKEAMKAHEWDIVADDENLNEQYAEDIAAVKEFFELPDRRQTWDSWLGQLLEDLLTIDAPTIYIRRTREGRVWGLEIIDGSTIKVLVDDRGFQPLPPSPAYQQYLYGTPNVNLTADELIYRPRNRRPNHFYGFSPIEQLIVVINMGLRREFYNLAQFTDGNIPAAFLKMPPEWTPQQIKTYMEYVNAVLAGDPQARAKFFPIPGTAGSVDKFRDDEVFGLHNTFDEWMARIICYAFGMSPTTFIKMTNRSVGEEMGDVEAEQGFASVKLYVENLMNWIIDHPLGMPHLRFTYTTDRGRLKSKVVSANVEYLKTGAKQIDEVRRENGDPPLGLPPGMVTATGFVPFPVPGAPAVPLSPMDPNAAIAPDGAMDPGPDDVFQDPNAAPPVEQNVETSGDWQQPEYSYAAMAKALDRARLEELGQWERFAIARAGGARKDGKAFQTSFILKPEADLIAKALQSSRTPDEIRHVFATRRMAKRPIRLKPPHPGEASRFTSELRSELKTYLSSRAREAVSRVEKPEGKMANAGSSVIPQITITPQINVPAAPAPIVNVTPHIDVHPSAPPDVRVEPRFTVPQAPAPVVKVDNVVNVPAQAPPTVTNEISVPPATVNVEAPPAPLAKAADEKKKKRYIINRDQDGRMSSMEVTEY